MSLGRMFSVLCDTRGAEQAAGCQRWIGHRSTSAEVRKLARASGWKRQPGYGRNSRDVCPACARLLDAE